MPERLSRWYLDGFFEQLDLWAEREHPDQDLVLVVAAWIMTRADDPYQGVRRAEGFENLWFGPVPDAVLDTARVVTCSYWISEATHHVRCDSFAILGLPL